MTVLHSRLAILLFALTLPAAAQAADGAVSLYLQPFPREARGLTLEIEAVSVLTASGAERPLDLRLRAAGGGQSPRQRLLAWGRVPSGAYSGVRLRLKRATLQGPGGEVALALPETPIRTDVPFVVADRQFPVVWLSLTAAEPIAAAAPFGPAFTAVVPARPIADHAGFVSNSAASTITVFDKQVMQAVAVIGTCAGPAGLALDQRRRRLFVACPNDDEVQAVDVVTGDLIQQASASPGDRPTELALTPDGNVLVAVNPGSNSVTFFETGTLARQDRVGVGSGPGSVAIDPAGRRAFVFNTLSASISVVDLASRAVVATLSTEASPLRGQFGPRGDRLYVIHDRSPYLTVYDAQQLTLVTRARVTPGVGAIAVDRIRGLVLLGGPNQAAVEFVDPNALMPLYAMKTGGGVSYLAIVPDDNGFYMVSPDTRSLLVARLADRRVVTAIDVGDGPAWVAIMGEK